MNEVRKQFYETTKRYFSNNNESSIQEGYNTQESEIKKYHIKEEPFINPSEMVHQ